MTDAKRLALVQRHLAAPTCIPDDPVWICWLAFHVEYDATIRAIIRSRHPRQKDIDDLSQDVWFILIQRLPTLALDPARGSLREWIAAIARNHACWCAARQARRLDVMLTPELAALLLDPATGPVSEFDRKQQQDQVRAIVERVGASLPALSCRIVSMHWLGEQSAADIAVELGLSEYRVRAIILRSKIKLSRSLLCNGFQDNANKIRNQRGFRDNFPVEVTIDSIETEEE